MINTFYEFLFCLIDVLLLYYFCTVFFERNKNRIVTSIYISILTVALFVIASIFNGITTWLTLCFSVIFSCIVFKGRKTSISFYVITYYILYGLYTMLTLNFILIATDLDPSRFASNEYLFRVIYILMTRLPLFILFYIMKIKNNKKYEFIIFKKIFSLFLFSIMALLIFLFNLVLNEQNYLKNIDILFLLIIIIAIVLSVCSLIVSYIKLEIENYNFKYRQKLNEVEYKYYLLRAQNDIDIRVMKHDLKNNLLSLKFILENNKVDDAITYINELYNSKPLSSLELTNNVILNALLNVKMSDNPEIKFVTDISVENINLKDTDLTSLFGNLLDNAVESVKEVSDKTINITMKGTEEVVYICVSNPYKHLKVDNNNRLLTLKKDKKQHGLGMSSIESIVVKNDGEMSYKYDGNIFMIEIYFFHCNA